MSTPADVPANGRKSPGQRQLPHRLTTGLFSRSRKGSDGRSPTISLPSPTGPLKSPSRSMTDMAPATSSSRGEAGLALGAGFGTAGARGGAAASAGAGNGGGAGASERNERPGTEPIAIPSSSAQLRGKHKKLAPATFNTHYRTISRSMNDLGNIFSRGRSPPNREVSPRRGTPLNTLPEGSRIAGGGSASGSTESSSMRTMESNSVPVISIMQHGMQPIHHGGGQHGDFGRGDVVREGWINVADSHTVKKMPSLKEAFKLQHAVITNGCLMLYKPPSGVQIKAFDLTAAPSTVQRPQTAPATASPNFSVSSLRHRSTARHPELVIGDDGHVTEGTVEALCHELMFAEDATFVGHAAKSLSGWTGPETALSVLVELATLKDSARRIGEILTIVVDSTRGLLLEPGCYNATRLLVEKGVSPHDQELAKALRHRIEDRASRLRAALRFPEHDSGKQYPPLVRPRTLLRRHPESAQTSDGNQPMTLSTDEFLNIDANVLATQIHLFHLKYFNAWSPVNDISLLLVSPHLPPPSHRNPLVFSTAGIHFLGERVMKHVLYGESVSSLELRADALAHWIHVALLLKAKGDMVGYLAITIAVLSPPILRLRETWSLLEPSTVLDLRDSGGKAMRILERRRLSGETETADSGRAFVPRGVGTKIPTSKAVPFFGDLCHCMDDTYAHRGRNIDFQKSVVGLEAMHLALEKWKKEWVDWEGVQQTKDDTPEDEQIQICLESLNANNQNPPAANATMFFERSLMCEPSISGLYLHAHYHQKLPLSTGANIPLVFTDVLPSYAIFDRYHALQITSNLHKKTPSSGLGSPGIAAPAYTPNSQNLRPPVAHSQPPHIRRTHSFPPSKPNAQTTGYVELDHTTRQKTEGLHGEDDAMIRAIRDVAGVGQQLFYSKDGELVLKAITEEDTRSRPSSVIENTSSRQSTSSRRYSQIHSNGASPRMSTHSENSPSTPITTPTKEEFGSNPASESSRALLVVPKGGTLERLVDILVLGVDDFSKRMNSSEESNPPLRMNMDVFTVTFFATFRRYDTRLFAKAFINFSTATALPSY